ncbi:unnamed protein product [Gordionus sp. m RMFG-2023]
MALVLFDVAKSTLRFYGQRVNDICFVYSRRERDHLRRNGLHDIIAAKPGSQGNASSKLLSVILSMSAPKAGF